MGQDGKQTKQVCALLRGSEYVLAVIGRPRRRDQARLQVGIVYVNRRAVDDYTTWGLFPEGTLLLGRVRGERPPYLAAVRVHRGALQDRTLEEVAPWIPWAQLLALLRGRIQRGEAGYRSRRRQPAAEQ